MDALFNSMKEEPLKSALKKPGESVIHNKGIGYVANMFQSKFSGIRGF
jgi:hypothetical protein